MVLTSNPQPVNWPLVTVVTSTYERPLTLRDCAVWAVERQTYPNIEHVVVIDGSDKPTINMLDALGYSYGLSSRRLVVLGRNWTSYSQDGGAGAACRLVGSWMAAGEYIAYLDDDVIYEPTHIADMVAVFEPDTQFVTTQCYGAGFAVTPGPPPGVNRTDTSAIMHRAIVLRDAGGFQLDGYTGDGNMIERWLEKGLTWKFKEGPLTVYHPTGHNSGRPMP